MSAPPITKAFSQAAVRPPKRKKAPPLFSIRFTEAKRVQLERNAGALSLAAYIRLKLFAGHKPFVGEELSCPVDQADMARWSKWPTPHGHLADPR